LTVRIDGREQWTARLALPAGATWQPGLYAGAANYPFQQPTQPGLDFSGEGRGCNEITGWFEIIEIQVVGSSVLSLAIDFIQHCEGGAPALFGAIRVNSNVPLQREVAYAIVPPVPPLTEGEEVVLDASDSVSRNGSLTYQWIQTGGTPVVLQGADSAVATFTAPDVASGGESLTFSLTVTDGAGNTGSSTVSVFIHDTADARTRVYVDSPAGDWIGAGAEQAFTAPTSAITASVTNGNTFLSVSFDGWRAEFEAPTGRSLTPGDFERATRYPFNSPSIPGLAVRSPGRGCNRLEGWFRIHEATYSGSTVVKLAADFLQSCDGGPELFGAIRINSAIPPQRPQPYARVTGPGISTEGEPVALDGGLSFDRDDALVSFQWVQLEGTTVATTGAGTAQLQFTAPDVAPGGEVLRFSLTVTDAAGNADSTTVAVTVRDAADPRSAVFLKSDAGDWVGQGLTYEYNEADTTFTTSLSSYLTVGIDGNELWSARFALPQGESWAPGTYASAQR
jgi:hypothetical protein